MKSERTSTHSQMVLALLLIVGMYLPSSTDGEHSRFWVFILFAALISLLGYLAWNLGVFRGTVTRISLPILIVLLVCTFVAFIQGPSQFDFGMFVKFSALAMVLCLDLRGLRPGRLVYRAFVLVNCISIALGTGILVGSDWATEFVTKYYWSFYPGLVPAMLSLHKPVLEFHPSFRIDLIYVSRSWRARSCSNERLVMGNPAQVGYRGGVMFSCVSAICSSYCCISGRPACGPPAVCRWSLSE